MFYPKWWVMKKKILCLSILLSALFFTFGCGEGDSSTAQVEDEPSSSSEAEDGDGQDNSSGSSKSSSSTTDGSSSSKSKVKTRPDKVEFEQGTFVDERDGQEYKYVTIGNQTWMAENLNYKIEPGSWCVEEGEKGCKKFGRAYTWAAVLDTANSGCNPNKQCEYPFQGACPKGWHVPILDEWDTLVSVTSQKRKDDDSYKGVAYLYLAKENCYYCGSDDYGFSIRTNKDSLSRLIQFYTSNNFNYENVHYIYGYRRGVYVDIDLYDIDVNGVDRSSTAPKMVRCVKDEIDRPDIKNPKTVKSTAEGCEDAVWQPRVQPCNDGTTDNCVYEGGGVKIGDKVWKKGAVNTTPYYNGATCGDGWYVADSLDWENLFKDVGGKCFASLMLKSSSGWDAGNGINAYGLNITPTGHYDVWVDYEKKTARLDNREFNGERTDAGFFVYAENNSYRNVFAFNTTQNVYWSSRTSTSANLLCIKGYREDEKADPEKEVFINPDFDYGEFTDPRDKQVYKTTIIGQQKWMAQNLRYETEKSKTVEARKYGQHYTYEDALEVCPDGWHLPSQAEFDTLIYIGAKEYKSRRLLSKDESSYYSDETGFSMGLIASEDYSRPHYTASFWSSTKITDTTAAMLYAYKNSSDTLYTTEARMRVHKSVRCVNDTAFTYGYTGKYETLEDARDGHTYKAVEIGGATWMVENLNFKTDSSYCQLDSCDVYGRHYKYPFTSEEGGDLCPDGWHISTTADWEKLLASTYDKDSTSVGLKNPFAWPMKVQGNNAYGFNALPNGCYNDYDFGSPRTVACFGVENSDAEDETGYYYNMSGNKVMRDTISAGDYFGIRCVKNP